MILAYRFFLAFVILGHIVSAGVLRAAPASSAEAIAFVQSLQEEFSNAARATANDTRSDARLVRLVSARFDLPVISRMVLEGSPAATPAQRNRLVAILARRAAAAMIARAGDASRARLTITGARVASANTILVNGRVESGAASAILSWRLRADGAVMRVIDVIRDGGSLVAAERRAFETALARRNGSIDAAIDELATRQAPD